MRIFWDFFPLLNISKLWKANGIFEIWDSFIQAYIDQIRHLVPPHVQPRVQSWRGPEQWIHLIFPWAWIGCSGYKDATFEAELRHLTSSNSPLTPDKISLTQTCFLSLPELTPKATCILSSEEPNATRANPTRICRNIMPALILKYLTLDFLGLHTLHSSKVFARQTHYIFKKGLGHSKSSL